MVEFKNKKILVYGFGRSGKSCLNYLKKDNIVKIYACKAQTNSSNNAKAKASPKESVPPSQF